METGERSRRAAGPPTARLGRYRILERLGRGGMAEVMVAVMPGPARFSKLLVIKTIRDDIQILDSQYARMFLDEARLAARLNHQNVVQTYEVGEHEGQYYIAMEYLEGQSLRQMQRRLGGDRLPLEARLRILYDTALGLHHAHELRDISGNPLEVVHRDVSPQNIFLTYDGQVKLLDFGIAKAVDADVATNVGDIKGKIDYMAPEQVKAEPVDRRADVFALGAVMWELLANQPLSGGGKYSQVTRVHNRVADLESNLRTVVPDVDPELARICDRALAYRREDRYATAQDFAHDLQAFVAERSLLPTAEQLSRVLVSTFDKERATLRMTIEDALARLEHEETSEPPPWEQEAEQSEHTFERLSRSLQAANHSGTVADVPLAAPMEPRRSRWPRLLFVAAAMGVAAWLAMGGNVDELLARIQPPPVATDGTPPSQAPAPQVAPSSPPPIAPAEPAPVPAAAPAVEGQAAGQPATVRLRISVATPDASVTLDGALLGAMPFEAEVARDNAIHRLVATAPGHERLSRAVVFDRDQVVELELAPAAKQAKPGPQRVADRRKRRGRRETSKGRPVVTAEPKPGAALHHDRKARQPIDEKDPYL